MDKEQIFKEIVDIVGPENVSSEPEDLIPYMRDAYTILMHESPSMPDFVVLPESKEEILKIIKLANKYKIPVYPRSFGVNIASSAVPYKGGLILDLKRMNRIIEINEETMTATVEPGVSWGKLRKEARKKGLDIIPILGPYEVGPVGNFLLTNITAYSTKYPADRAVTLEVILPNGEIIRTGSQSILSGEKLNPYFRYAYGPDLTGLFRGSLGNFGVITKLVIRLRPLAEVEKNVGYKFEDLDLVLKTLQKIERLEITRHSWIFNKYLALHIFLHPEKIRIKDEVKTFLANFPTYIYVVGLGGKSKQVTLYEEIIEEEIKNEACEKVEFDREMEKIFNEVCEGASQKVIRMFVPYAGFAAVIGCVPISRVKGMVNTVKELIKKHDLKDPVTNEQLEPEIIIIPYDRGSTVYVEQELLYNPVDKTSIEKVRNCLRECYRELLIKYGAVHTMPNKSLLRFMLPGNVKLLTGIKKIVDPNGIFMPGGPYSVEV